MHLMQDSKRKNLIILQKNQNNNNILCNRLLLTSRTMRKDQIVNEVKL